VKRYLGTLLVVFGGLGVLFGGLGVIAGPGAPDKAAAVWQSYAAINTGFGIFGVLLGALELVAGVFVQRDNPRGPKLAIAYAALAIASTLVWLGLVFAWLGPALGPGGLGSAMGIGIVFAALAGLVWPTIVIVVVRRP